MANMSVNTFSPSDVKLILGGYTVVGWDNLTTARTQQSFMTIRGIRGKHTRVPSDDTSCTITLTLIQTSPSNDVLSSIHGLDVENGTGRLEILLKDLSGRSVFSTNEGYIVGYPEVTFSAGIEYRTWTMFCQRSSWYVGGNSKPETSLVDSILGGLASSAGNIF